MLSFINMGGRKKRPRKKGSRNFNGPSSRGPRRNSRESGSFMTSGTVGDIVIERRPSARPVLSGEPSRRNAVDGMKDAVTSALVETTSAPKRSPEIQLEFKHDSLLQSLPEEFLRYRKGSMTNSVDDTRPSPYMQGIERTSNFEGSPRSLRAPQEKGRRMGPLPTVTPIKIPASPLQSIPPNSQQRISRTRHSLTANSLAWASDSEVSPVSGMSAARDVLAESFSFSARGNVFGDASTKERDSGGRFARQDSATLPKENVWEGLTYSPSISRRSSTHSIKKRKHDIRATDLPPFDASALPTPRCRKDEVKGKAKHEDTEAEQPPPPPRKDSMHNHQRSRTTTRNPPPPGLTPSAQKLGQSDQAALHRISRISEADVEASSSPLVVPTSGSTSDSFSRKSKAHSRSRKGTPVLSSPLKVPSVLSTPSTYSQYTASPFASPNKSAGASSSKSEYDYESFLEDFEFVSSGPSSRGGKSGYAGSADSPGFVQVPMTARSVSSASGSNSASATGSAGFPQRSPNTSSRAVQASTAKRRRERSSSSSRNPLARAKVSGSANDQFPNNTRRNGSTSSAVAVIGKSPISSPSSHEALQSVSDSNKAVFQFSGGIAKSNGLSPNADHAADSIHSPLKVQSTNPKDSESEMRRPPLPQLHVTNRGDSPSPPSSASPPSCRSPDLLDMLIPNGHIVTPISRRQVGRKRSGSTPSPIKITPAHSLRYLPMNGDDDELEINDVRNSVPEVTMGAENAPLSGDIQTFPETPVLFSPDYAMSIVSRSNSITLAAKHPNTTPYLSSKNTIPLQSLVITPASCTTEVTKIAPIEPNGGLSVNNEATSMSSACSNSPPISPLQPPPPSPASVFPAPKVQTVLNAVRQSPPLLEPVPKRRASHIRPPLPFGPRKPNSHVGKSTITAPLTFAPRRSASESAAGNSRAITNAELAPKRPESPLPTPTFKTTPVTWRGLTLDAAKWTFSSSQLQSIVRTAIEQSAQVSSIRLLSRDVYEKLPVEIDKLEARRLDIQKDYKVLVRRRRSFIQRLTSLSSNGRVVDITAVVRDAEELAKITTYCDKLVEELHNVDDQIAQMCRLQDVHQASALAVALRKLNASLFRQTSEVQRLQSEIINIHAERDEAWRKAEELEHDLDALAEQSGSSRRKSVSSSRRSSRVSLARKSSSRTSKAGLRLSGHSYQRHSQRSSVSSSLLVHHATSARTTFSSDIVPPVPPLPIMDPSYRFGTSGMPSSHPPTSIAQTSVIPSTSDGLYNDVYDLLGVKHADRSIPSPSRPHSEIYCIPPPCTRESDRKQTGYAVNVKPAFHSETMRFRSGSLPSLVPPQPEIEDADAIIAMLDFRD